MQRTELMTWLQQELAVDMFKDYAPNGLQLQGKSDIGHLRGDCKLGGNRSGD